MKRLRQEHLPAIPDRGDTRTLCTSRPTLRRQPRLARVRPHPHANRPAGQCVLAVRISGDRVRRARECDEKRITLRVDLDALGFGKHRAESPPMLVQCLVVAELMHQPRRSPTSVNSNVTTPVGRPPTTAHDHAPTPVCCPADERRRRRWESAQWFVETPLRSLETAPEPADEAVLRDPEVRANFAASNLEGARQGQAGLVGDWVADALPWGFRLADVGVPVDLWIGERDPGRAPLDAPEIARRIPSCAVHADPDAGHWLVISRWSDIVEQSLA